jgi:aspartate aminotransferase
MRTPRLDAGEAPRDLWPDPGLAVPRYWLERLAAAVAGPGPGDAEPVGGGPAIRRAAAGYWSRRGLVTRPDQVVVAPGAEPLLLALLVAVGGDAVVPWPGAAWHTGLVRLLGRHPLTVPTPAEGGGAPDPFALLEAVRRAREEGGDPRLLVMAGADDPTGTVTPPELLHEVCEAAADIGLLLVSDETYADTVHHHEETVLLSPAETMPGRTVVLTDLGATLVPPGWPVAAAHLPATGYGSELRSAVLAACVELRAVLPGPVAEAAAYVLGEPDEVRDRVAAANRLHAAVAAAAHRVVTASGALCRPPEAGFQLYADIGPLGTGLDAPALERRLGLPGGHRFGDDPSAARVRVGTGALYGTDDAQRAAALAAADPLRLPHIAAALRDLAAAFAALPVVG